jgi:hypothetical protein
MKLFAFQRRKEGDELPESIFGFWVLRINYGNGPVLRSFGAQLMIPIPITSTYLGPWDLTYRRGKRWPTIGIRFSLVRGEWKRLIVGTMAWMRPVGQQETVATLEQIQDGLYPPKEGVK